MATGASFCASGWTADPGESAVGWPARNVPATERRLVPHPSPSEYLCIE
jgi:hypothetical protein